MGLRFQLMTPTAPLETLGRGEVAQLFEVTFARVTQACALAANGSWFAPCIPPSCRAVIVDAIQTLVSWGSLSEKKCKEV